MAKNNQEKPASKPNEPKPISISKIEVGTIKNGRITSEAPPKPEKPAKGNI